MRSRTKRPPKSSVMMSRTIRQELFKVHSYLRQRDSFIDIIRLVTRSTQYAAFFSEHGGKRLSFLGARNRYLGIFAIGVFRLAVMPFPITTILHFLAVEHDL